MHSPETERALKARFDVRTERFGHREFTVEMLLPDAADELIDEAEFDADERLPYWAELWPSARGLTRHLLDSPPPAGARTLELGCGVALPSLALQWQGLPVLATDYYPDALSFARVNAERNGLAPLQTQLLDWRDPPADLGQFPCVLAADLLYERRNGETLLTLLPRVVEPRGTVWLADPGRVYLGEFLEGVTSLGWQTKRLGIRTEPSAGSSTSEVQIWALARPAA